MAKQDVSTSSALARRRASQEQAAPRVWRAPALVTVRSSASWLLLMLIRVYQWTISPLLGAGCRFEPSCSRYTALCIERLGPARGVWLGVRRIARCHPFCDGGYDPPPEISH